MYRVMIVDDENKIRQGLTWLIDWKALNCQVVYGATNGQDAIDQLEILQPHIILTDIRMPKVNGLELAQYIQEKKLPIQVIILTGFADFEYSQKAIKYNVRDFILKPTRHEELEETIRRTIDIIKESEATESSNQKAMEFVLQKSMLQLGLDEKEQHILQHLKEINEGYYRCISLKLYPQSTDNHESSLHVSRYFKHAILKAIHQVFEGSHYYLIAPHHDVITLILFHHEEWHVIQDDLLHQRCTDLMGILTTFKEEVAIKLGISLNYTELKYLSQAYIESLSAIDSVFYNKESHIFSFQDSSTALPHKSNKRVDEHLNQAGNHMASSDSQVIETYLKDFLHIMHEERLHSDNYRHYALIMLEFLAKIDPENTSMNRLKDYQDSHMLIIKEHTAEDIEGVLLTIFEAIKMKLSETQGHHLVNEAHRFIKEHLSSTISLQDVAEHLHVNSSYFSRLYKKTTGITLTEAINTQKIDQAKELLLTTNAKIYDVARQVGFDDAAYFSQLFRRYAGINPTEYRASLKNT